MATLAIFRPRRIVRWTYLLRHSGRLRTVTCAASTNRKRNREFPCFLLLAFPLPTDLGGVSDPQFKVQFCQQSLEPARMSAGFHPHAHLLSLDRELTVELLRYLRVLQSPLLQFPGFGIYKSNLLKGRVVICSYNDHCSAPFSRALVGSHHQSLPGPGSRHCHGINFTCAVKRHWSTAGESPARELGSLHPEAIGAAVEETKPSEPPVWRVT